MFLIFNNKTTVGEIKIVNQELLMLLDKGTRFLISPEVANGIVHTINIAHIPAESVSDYERGHRDGVNQATAGVTEIVKDLETEIARLNGLNTALETQWEIELKQRYE